MSFSRSVCYDLNPKVIFDLCHGYRFREIVIKTDAVRSLTLQKYTATSLTRKHPAPKNSPRTLGIGLRCDPRGGWFLMGEVPLYAKIFTLELLSDRCHGYRFRETVIDTEAVRSLT